jgi:hypothetical protein
VPLLATWALCINGALQAPIDKRFSGFNATGVKARALAALLIYLGPLLRGWERIKWRVKGMRGQPHIAPMETEQRASFVWKECAFHLSYWSDAGAEKEILLNGLRDFLVPQKYLVVADTGWNRWDLKIARGLCSRALVTVCSENHGGEKRLLRVRCAMRLSQLALLVLRSSGAVAAIALMLDWPLVGAIIGAIGIVSAGMMGWQLVGFGRLMHRIIETVAKQAQLMPVAPMARPRSDMRRRSCRVTQNGVSLEATSRASTQSPVAGD